ncbi:fas-binding factor 1 [Uranotaenia lowii]|uniref:fas-binding factor 1 n=1 Tax=Uranotaenia lowii TaxID=190385 RepID=UPI002479C081|nr:fas-binding factor 1 [Uranotaenia lowii]
MNFDLDDPLDGLLSDGSNDSLFGTEPSKKGKKTATVSKPETKQTKMEDLFGIKTETAPAAKPAIDPPAPAKPLTLTSGSFEKEGQSSLEFTRHSISGPPASLTSFQTKKTSTPVKKPDTSQKKEITFDDSDVLSDLGFDPKKPKSKSNILDDILGGPIISAGKEPGASKQNKPKLSLGVGKEDVQASKSISRQSTETSENLQTESTIMGGYAPTGGAQRRSGRRKSSNALNDPLGLFSITTEPKKEVKAAKKGADWLGLNDDSISNDPEPVPMSRNNPEESKPIETPKPLPVLPPEQPQTAVPQLIQPTVQTAQPPISVPLSTILKPDIKTAAQTMEILNNETQNALNTMQQQEFHLQMANQMKNQEQALLEMQHKQQAILQRQESQFNELLQKQIQRHNVLEEVIAKQQERINTNIQMMMMSQPPQVQPLLVDHFTSKQKLTEDEVPKESNQDNILTRIELEADLKRLEMEKLRLEDLIANITANHEQEVTMLEQSYRKQMGFLEESLKIMEARMKAENKSLEDFYKNKLNDLEEEKQSIIGEHTKKVNEMEDNHRKAIEKLKTTYEESVENLKQEHREMISNIRESKLMEFSVLQDNASYMTMLKNASSYLENASGDLQQLRDTLQEQIEFAQKEKDIQLKAREKQLEDQQRLLERTKESAEVEKERLLNLVETLEGKLTEIAKTSSEEHWTYQQRLAKLESERKAFEKEKEQSRERISREESRIEELKRAQLEEHGSLMAKIEEERKTLLEEKAKLETLSKLHKRDQPEHLSRAEIDAAIRVAEDAAKQADTERDHYLQLQRRFETKRRELISQESQLRTKSGELETALNEARLKALNAENAFKSIKKAEQNLQLKMQLVQRQFREISEREDRLSKDKIELSKERLELQTVRKKLQTTRCSLCKIGDRSQEIGDYLTAAGGNNSESVADDRKLEANFFELQQQQLRSSAAKVDNFFDGDLERQLQAFLERNRVDEDEFGLNVGPPNIAENEDGTIDTDLLLLKFDVLKSQNFFNSHDK